MRTMLVMSCLVVFGACSGTPPCSASTCPFGCCDVNGQCQTASAQTCGSSGLACMACGVGQQCVAGTCATTGAGGGSSASGGGTASGGGGGTSLTGGGTGATGGGGGTSTFDCTEQVAAVQGSGGCVLAIVSPSNCQTVDFSGGFVEISYTTNTTFCEGPHHLFLLGHPSSTWAAGNGMDITLSSTDGNFVAIGSNGSSYAMTRNIGGVLRLARADLAPLMSTNGQFHVSVTGFYALDNGGSRSASRTFVVP